MTAYFTIFGIIIFYATTNLYLMVFRQSTVNYLTKYINAQFNEKGNVNEGDFIWHSIGQSRPDLWATFRTFVSFTPALYSLEDVCIYCKNKDDQTWYKIYLRDDQFIHAQASVDEALDKYDKKLKLPLVLTNFHFNLTKEKLDMYQDITGEKDTHKYFLKMTLHRQGLWDILAPTGFKLTISVFIFLLLTRALGSWFSKKLTKPIELLSEGVASVANGRMDVTIDVRSRDEIGELAKNFNLMTEGLRERDLIKETFGKYVTKEIRDEILKGCIPLDGELKEVTILFADLRNFTTLSESMSPKETAKLINEYFEEMAHAIHQYKGVLIQFIGDEIEAVFGAPFPLPEHADKAVSAALEMRKRLDGLNRRLDQQNRPQLQHGIGIHTGQVLAANIGSSDRLSYALVGDTVNLASRIQGLNKTFSSDILISSNTYEKLTHSVKLVEMPETPIRGRTESITPYKVL